MTREIYQSCTVCQAGWCAPTRCYCGHEECNAYATWIDLSKRNLKPVIVEAQTHHAEAWANRGDNSWIDKL